MRRSDRPRCQVAESLGIADGTLVAWIAEFADRDAPGALSNDERAELVRLRKELAEVKEEREILRKAISKIKGGVRISDLGNFIEKQAKRKGFTTLRNLTGHGIGRKLHEEPRYIYNYHEKDGDRRFRKNSVIAVETFISTGARIVTETSDGWTLTADDGSFVAQHEHTLVVTDKEPIILTLNNGIFD